MNKYLLGLMLISAGSLFSMEEPEQIVSTKERDLELQFGSKGAGTRLLAKSGNEGKELILREILRKLPVPFNTYTGPDKNAWIVKLDVVSTLHKHNLLKDVLFAIAESTELRNTCVLCGSTNQTFKYEKREHAKGSLKRHLINGCLAQVLSKYQEDKMAITVINNFDPVNNDQIELEEEIAQELDQRKYQLLIDQIQLDQNEDELIKQVLKKQKRERNFKS